MVASYVRENLISSSSTRGMYAMQIVMYVAITVNS